MSHEILTAVFQIMSLHFGILQFHTGVAHCTVYVDLLGCSKDPLIVTKVLLLNTDSCTDQSPGRFALPLH